MTGQVDRAAIRPVFIIGCPRSGTTLALDLMASHEAFAWVSDRVNRSPHRLELTRLNRAYDLPLVGRYLYLYKKRRPLRAWLPTPVEPWHFWETYLEHFRWARGGPGPPRRRTPGDITPDEGARIRLVVDEICIRQNKQRFLSKYTDFPRIRYLNQAFPEAKFVHIVRDGRAAAFSLYERLTTQWSRYWTERDWWVSGWPEAWRRQWHYEFGCPLSFAAFQWAFFLNEIRKDAGALRSGRYIEVRYRDMVGDPVGTLADVFAFCGLDRSRRTVWYVGRVPLANMNRKWRQNLDEGQKALLEEIVAQHVRDGGEVG